MPKYSKHIALIAAAALLCGCSGNTSYDTPRTSAEESVQGSEPISAEAEKGDSSPAGESVSDNTAASNAAEPVDPSAGVTLVSGGDSQYSGVFDLNGKWCDPSDLPIEISTYDVPLFGRENFIFFKCCGRKLYFIERSDHYDMYWSANKLWSYDPATGEEKLLFDGCEKIQNIFYANEQYIVMDRYDTEARDGTSDYTMHLTVVDLLTGETVFDVPNSADGNIRYIPRRGVQISYDMMYITADYIMPEFDETLNVGLTVDLTSGKTNLYGFDYNSVDYGVGNICFANGSTVTSIRGDSRPYFSDIDDITYIHNNMYNTYYIISVTDRSYDILGSRSTLCWTDRSNTVRKIGETAFSVNAVSNAFTMNRDNIFCATLWKDLPSTTWSEDERCELQDFKYWLLLGEYNTLTDSAQASLIELPPDEIPAIYAENDCIYLVYGKDRKVSEICARKK